MKAPPFVLPLLILAVSGCCGMSAPSASSSFCPLGTYGSACSDLCGKARGTEYDGGPTCVSDCMDMARQGGLGDATTCCRESIGQACQRTCAAQVSGAIFRYGGDASSPEAQEEIAECVGECTAPYVQMGVPLEACNVIGSGSFGD